MFNRRLLIDSGEEQQTYSVLEIHVDTPEGGNISSARVEIAYDGNSNIQMTDNKGIALFSDIPTGKEITYEITTAGYNAASGTWIIDTDVEYETKYVVLTKPLPSEDTNLWYSNEYDYYGEFDITIPAGVTVLFIGATVNGGESGEPCYVSMQSKTKQWFYVGSDDRAEAERYIGVTPLKTYHITVDYGSELGATYGYAFIRYSQRINGVTPNVLDY